MTKVPVPFRTIRSTNIVGLFVCDHFTKVIAMIQPTVLAASTVRVCFLYLHKRCQIVTGLVFPGTRFYYHDVVTEAER
jgi:hypothetical protein